MWRVTTFRQRWDCDIEKYASDIMCGTAVTGDYYAMTETFKNGNDCNATVQTNTLLKKWWDESNAINLADSLEYSGDVPTKAPDFSHMAYAPVRAFACTYGTCPSTTGLKLTCVYKRKIPTTTKPPAKTPVIYAKVKSLEKVCSLCKTTLQTEPCIKHLCQQEYVPAGDIPKRACAAQDGLSNDLQDIAVDMHNYYRRLVATGWDPTKDGYAPRAKAMNALNYDCGDPKVQDNIGSATKTLVDNCPKDAPTATGGYSLNHYYENTYKLSPEELLEKAITNWADEVSKVGKDNIYTKGAGFDNYANMMHDESDKITCAVNVCTQSGGSAVVCQYNIPPDEGDAIYQMGAPCKACPAAAPCDDKLGGLCVKPQP
ncbi:SCP-like protein [Ancylostoma caninum]|uniref:SCP-like protein n=1 Tax=Ancylostoma caninum TaxID=29170 RepID=A0A368GVW4_ANCCA|nr:SCP-like protein [Ancylostoma caninum]